MPYISLRDGAQLYYKDWGNKTGPTVVFSHGWPLDADTWEAQMFFLSNKGCRTVAHDRRGHGRSEQTWDRNDVDNWADDLSELIEHLDLKDVILVGHSTGGGELVRYCTRRKYTRALIEQTSSTIANQLARCIDGTSRVKKLVLISTVVPLLLQTPSNPEGVPLETLDTFRSAMEKDRAQFFLDVPTGPFFGYNRPNATASNGQIQAWFAQGMAAGLKASYDTTFSWQVDYTEDAKALNVPVLVLQGDDDQIVPVGCSARKIGPLLKDGTIKIYPGGAHAIPNTQPDEVNKDLWEFIQA